MYDFADLFQQTFSPSHTHLLTQLNNLIKNCFLIVIVFGFTGQLYDNKWHRLFKQNVGNKNGVKENLASKNNFTAVAC